MSRFRIILIGGMLIGLTTLVSACTTQRPANSPDFQYQPGDSVNPACADGFRPTNALSCSY
ncbi:hypothetical protein [Rhizobium sp. GCM10022189]|jgi:hypothetical protein|uniref:hypothetical protein n=1 Tax=Rhizobium sp. GCM10022189 TaxID=3252654 RepID=UPI000DE52E33